MTKNCSSTTSFQALWTPFVMHRVTDCDDSFNSAVHDLASSYEAYVRQARSGFPSEKHNNLGYGGCDLIEYAENNATMKQLASIVQEACSDFLYMAYGYTHDGDMLMNAGTFWQYGDQRLGLPAHTHNKHDLVAIYYPVVNGGDDPMSDGSLRLYDPSNIGKRFWHSENTHSYYGGWYSIKPQKGSIIVFEGWVPHDSGYFDGRERLSIPFLVDVQTNRKHKMTAMSEIIGASDE
jgi:hypothetical protein